MQALHAVLAQHQRVVDFARLDLGGLWLSTNCWMHVVRQGGGFKYEARSALDEVVEHGTLQLSPGGVQITAHNVQLGTLKLPLAAP